MKILKLDNLTEKLFECPFCGCIFSANVLETELSIVGDLMVRCPQLKCGSAILWRSGISSFRATEDESIQNGI